MSVFKRKVSSLVAVIMACIVVIAVVVGFVAQEYKENIFKYVFYNDTASDEHKNHNSGNVLEESFSSNILAAAPAEVRNDPASNAEWFRNDLYNRVYSQTEDSGDPSLLGQLALDAQLRAPKTVGEKLLPSGRQSTEMWKEIVLKYIDDKGAHISTAGKLHAVWNSAKTVKVSKITGSYTSMGYQKRDGIKLEGKYVEQLGREAIPMPVLENTNGVTGWEITFIFENGEKLSYRIDCGYQPDGTSYSKPAPAEPTPAPTPTPSPDSTATPSAEIEITTPDSTPSVEIEITKPTPSPGRTPRPNRPADPPATAAPEPKNVENGPQGQNPNIPDYGDTPNQGVPDGPNPEASTPPTYVPPAAPATPAPDAGVYDETPASSGNNDHNVGNNETIAVDNDSDGQNDGLFGGEVTGGTQPEAPKEEIHEEPPALEPGTNTIPDGNGNLGGPPL